MEVSEGSVPNHNDLDEVRREALTVNACDRFLLMLCLTTGGAHKKTFLGGLRPARPPQLVGRCRDLLRLRPHGNRFGRPLSQPPKASVWGHVQDQPRSTCLVGMIWVKDKHAQAQHWLMHAQAQAPFQR